MSSVILYENLFKLGSLSVTSTNATSGYDKDNLLDERSYTLWKASSNATQYITVNLGYSKSANCIGIINHNLKSIDAGLIVQYYDGSAWNTADIISPENDNAIIRKFTTESGTQWRVGIYSAASTPFIGIVMLGACIEFQFPPVTPTIPKSEGIKANVVDSEAGHTLGVDIRYNDVMVNVSYRDLARTWVTDNFTPFWRDHGRLFKPFFFCWDISNDPESVVFARFDDGMRYQPSLSMLTYVDELTLQMRAVAE